MINPTQTLEEALAAYEMEASEYLTNGGEDSTWLEYAATCVKEARAREGKEH